MVMFQEFSSECAVLDWQDRDEEIERWRPYFLKIITALINVLKNITFTILYEPPLSPYCLGLQSFSSYYLCFLYFSTYICSDIEPEM